MIRSPLVALSVLALLIGGATPPPAPSLVPVAGTDGLECAEVAGQTVCVDRTEPARGSDLSLPSIAELRAGLGTDPAAASTIAIAASGTPGIACDGNGQDGNRVQAVYAYMGTRNRYGSVAPLIRRYAAQVDTIFRASAAQFGGSRRVRWATTSSCTLTITKVKISRAAWGDLWAFDREMRAKGFTRTDRKYLVWVDAPAPGACGWGGVAHDTRQGPQNRNNVGPSFAEVFAPCWGMSASSGRESAEAHELMHTLGSVLPGAPHATRSGHCYDEWDVMCYRGDGDPRMRTICSSTLRNRFDCRGDDYFNPKPRARSWLATHWNTAFSSFLIGADTGAPVVSTPVVDGEPYPLSQTRVTWTIKEDQLVNRVAVEQRVDAGAWTAVAGQRADALTLDDLPRGRTYTWRVRAMDSAGRWSAWATSAPHEIPLDALPVVTMQAPERTSWDPDAGAWNIAFAWEAEDADGWVELVSAELSADGGATFAPSDATYQQELAGTAGHTYVVRARALDNEGEWGAWAASGPVTITTDMAPVLQDVFAWVEDPGTMTALVGWNAYDEGEIAGSEITVATDGGAPTPIPGDTFPVASGHTYTINGRVQDAAGHWSSWASFELPVD